MDLFDEDETMYNNPVDNQDEKEAERQNRHDRLSVSKLDKNILYREKAIEMGTIRKEFVDFFNSHGMDGKLSETVPVVFWNDRISHTEDHRNDFSSDAIYRACFEEIPLIIQRPDYISIHPKRKDSISFIRDYSLDHVNVAIRVTFRKLNYRTMYPILSATLSHFMDEKNAWKVEYDADGVPHVIENGSLT